MNESDKIKTFFDSIEQDNLKEVIKILDKYPNLIHSKYLYGSFYKNPLCCAIQIDNFLMTKKFLKLGCKSIGYSSTSDIYYAVGNGNYEIFNLLLKYKYSPLTGENIKNNKMESKTNGCACGKIKHENCKVFSLNIIKKKPILHSAIRGGNILIIEKLLSMGCDVNNEDGQGLTALHIACIENNLECVKYLIENNAIIDYQTNLDKPLTNIYGYNKYFGCTPLHIAIINGSIEIIKFLINKGASINVKKKNETLLINDTTNLDVLMILYLYIKNKQQLNLNDLHLLAYNGNLNEFIIETKKDKSLIDNYNKNIKTPLHIAIRMNHNLIMKYIIENFGIIIEKSHIKIAIKYNNLFALKYLMGKLKVWKIKIKLEFSKYLLIAINNENLDIIKFLVENKNNLNLDNALIKVWQRGNYEIMKYLLDNGANPNVKTYCGSLLFDHYGIIIKKNNETEYIIKLLIDYGLNINSLNDEKKTIMEILIKQLKGKYLNNMMSKILITLLGQDNILFDLDKVKKIIENKKKKKLNVYNTKKVSCIADETKLEWILNENYYLPLIETLIKGQIECTICMEFNANYAIPICQHKIICSNCALKITNCPQCTKKI